MYVCVHACFSELCFVAAVIAGTLIHQMDTHHFHKDHVDVITETLMHIFCGKDMKVRCWVIRFMFSKSHILLLLLLLLCSILVM